MTQIRVLFVCSGNRYRSPIAERLFTARLGAHAPSFLVGSAGTVAAPGSPMSPHAAKSIADLGGASEPFAARLLTADLVASADLVLGLGREHREAAARMYPAALRRCFVLEEFVRLARAGTESGPVRHSDDPDSVPALVARAAEVRAWWPPAAPEADDVADPDGLPEQAVRWCAVRIDHAVRRLADALTGVTVAIDAPCVDG